MTASAGPSVWLSRLRDWVDHLSFRVKLALLVNLLIIVLIGGSAFLVEQRQRAAIVQEVEKRALVMAEALAGSVTSDLLTYNYVSIDQTLDQFKKKPDLVYAVVLDKEGNVAAQFIPHYPLSQLLEQRNDLKAGKATVDELHLPGTERETVYDVRLPVTIEGSQETWGVVRLGVSLQGMRQEITRTRWQIAGFVFLGLLAGSVGSIFLARRTARPIQALMRGVTAVGRGEFDHRIEIASRDEIGQLSAAFNEMIAQLSRVRDLEDRLRRADRLAALGTMAAGIAHDIRNPLTSILIFSQLMSLHHDDPDVREKFNRVVPRELERVQAVIEDMMELARPVTIHRDPVNLNEVFAQVLELFESQVATQQIKLAQEYDQDLPFCMADRKRLHRCFSNLVSNAIQAMPTGGDLTVRTAMVPTMVFPNSGLPDRQSEPALRVTVSDTGQGIPAAALAHIFEPKFTTKKHGLGIGLAVSRKIVEGHRGTIEALSQPGRGTSFRITIPAGG
jgi:signal transduction histidine kinase